MNKTGLLGLIRRAYVKASHIIGSDTAGEVLKSNGRGRPASFGPAGGGSREIIASIVADGDINLDFIGNITDTYDEYVLEGNGITIPTGGGIIQMILSADSGTSFFEGTLNHYHWQQMATSISTYSAVAGTALPFILVGQSIGSDADHSFNFTMQLSDLRSTTRSKYIRSQYVLGITANTASRGGRMFGYVDTTDQINTIRILVTVNTILTGRFTLYGIKKA